MKDLQYPRGSRDSRVARVAALSATWHGFPMANPAFKFYLIPFLFALGIEVSILG